MQVLEKKGTEYLWIDLPCPIFTRHMIKSNITSKLKRKYKEKMWNHTI